MRINQNIAAFNAYRNLNQTQNQQASSLEKLSSGFRINRAADDASGLVNSENLRSQIGGLKVATRNAQDAISLVQTAEGAQTEVHSILQRMRDLTVQSGNLGTNDTAALKANQDEINELAAELDRIAEQTQFGTKTILDGADAVAGEAVVEEAGTGDSETLAAALRDLGGEVAAALEGIDFGGETIGDNTEATARAADINAVLDSIEIGGTQLSDLIEASVDGSDDVEFTFTAVATLEADDAVTIGGEAAVVDQSFSFQVGANAGQQVNVSVAAVSAAGLGVSGIDVAGGDAETIDQALRDLDSAIGTVSENRATLGAFQNRMESTIRNVGVAVENLSAAESRIRDTDMAEEMVEFTRSQILSQAGTAMLAQANMVPQSVLQLLG